MTHKCVCVCVRAPARMRTHAAAFKAAFSRLALDTLRINAVFIPRERGREGGRGVADAPVPHGVPHCARAHYCLLIISEFLTF
jgi:hypothetical protein